MLYSEIIAVCAQIHTKHINTAVWAERRIFFDVVKKPTYAYKRLHDLVWFFTTPNKLNARSLIDVQSSNFLFVCLFVCLLQMMTYIFTKTYLTKNFQQKDERLRHGCGQRRTCAGWHRRLPPAPASLYAVHFFNRPQVPVWYGVETEGGWKEWASGSSR
jgi:hypothetical protein